LYRLSDRFRIAIVVEVTNGPARFSVMWTWRRGFASTTRYGWSETWRMRRWAIFGEFGNAASFAPP